MVDPAPGGRSCVAEDDVVGQLGQRINGIEDQCPAILGRVAVEDIMLHM